MPAQKLLCFITYCTVVCRYWPKAEMDSVLYEFWKEYRNIVFYFKFLTIFTVAGLQFKTSKKCHPKMGTLNVNVPKVPAIILICFLEKRQPENDTCGFLHETKWNCTILFSFCKMRLD